MVSTVTTTTVSTVSSVAVAASLGIMAVVLLIALLVTKELAANGDHPRLLSLNRLLNVAIYPLSVVFSAIVLQNAVSLL
jgi:hypothetical protein